MQVKPVEPGEVEEPGVSGDVVWCGTGQGQRVPAVEQHRRGLAAPGGERMDAAPHDGHGIAVSIPAHAGEPASRLMSDCHSTVDPRSRGGAVLWYSGRA